MGNILKAIYDDIDEYMDLCKKYGEKPEYVPTAQGGITPDCYGKHAGELKMRQDKEYKELKNKI